MFGFEKLDRHGDLSDRMARTVGVDLAGAMLAGRVSPFGLRSVVVRCMSCTEADRCEAWLATTPEAPEAPGYCRNRGLLGELADRAP